MAGEIVVKHYKIKEYTQERHNRERARSESSEKDILSLHEEQCSKLYYRRWEAQ